MCGDHNTAIRGNLHETWNTVDLVIGQIPWINFLCFQCNFAFHVQILVLLPCKVGKEMPTCISSVWVGPGWVPCEHSLRKLSVHDERAKAFAFDWTLMRYKFRWNAIEECSGSVSDEMIETGNGVTSDCFSRVTPLSMRIRLWSCQSNILQDFA